MVLLRVLILGWILALLSNVPACAQEVPPQAPAQWFTDQVLAPRSDWYRPDLAGSRVRQVTRTFQHNNSPLLQMLGNHHHAAQSDQQVQEVLSYDGQGYLLRYRYTLLPRNATGSAQVLGNQFTYDAEHRLRHIQTSGTKGMLAVPDLFSSKVYARWRKSDTAFRARHRLPASHEFRELFPETWQLHSITYGYDAAGRAQLPQAVVHFSGHTATLPERLVTWADTVPLDPQRDWHLATPDTLAGRADTAWLHHPSLWWQRHVPAEQAQGLRLQHLPQSSSFSASPQQDIYYANYPMVEADLGFTSFFGPTGQVQLARMPGAGAVWRYRYDAQGQPQQVEAYFMHLLHRYGDTLYFGGVHPVDPIADCEKRQREALLLPNGEQAVRELQYIQEVRYERNKQGLPTRAIVRTTTPHYKVDVSFSEMLRTHRPTGHDGPFVHVKNWRRAKAQLARKSRFQARGCVPMTLKTADTQEVLFSYLFF